MLKTFSSIRYEKNRYAMLDTLLEAEANGGQIDKEGIQEEVDTFMFEGYDTTSSGILFCLFMIATHQAEQQTMFEEISEIIRIPIVFKIYKYWYK